MSRERQDVAGQPAALPSLGSPPPSPAATRARGRAGAGIEAPGRRTPRRFWLGDCSLTPVTVPVPWTRMLRYGLAPVTVLVAAGLTALLWPASLEPGHSPLFFAAVVVTAVYGGIGPALLATGLALSAKAYFFMTPTGSLVIEDLDDVVQLLAFVVVAFLIGSLSGARKRAEERTAEQFRQAEAARAEAERANRTKDVILATVSHELRTPLGAIVNAARLLRAGEADEAARGRVVDLIERSARLQERLIDDLLDVSRIIAGTLRVEPNVVELPRVIASAVEILAPTIDTASVDLHVEIDRDVGPVRGDAARLQQVVSNLLANAVKFTPGGGAITVRLERHGEQARIVVQDTGRGIPSEQIPRIFEPFTPAASGARGGLGLGLSIVRHLVELHGGRVGVESAGEGSGSTFIVDLPVIPPPRSPGGGGPPRVETPLDYRETLSPRWTP
jgi:signal transduction histidine kinase